MKILAEFFSIIPPIFFPLSVSVSSVLFILMIISPLLKFKEFLNFSKKYGIFYILLFLFFISYIFSSIISYNPLYSLKKIREFLFYLAIPSTIFIFQGHKKRERILKIFILFSLLSAFYSFFQILKGKGDEIRAHGFFLHPLTYSGFLIIPLTFSVGFALTSKKKEKFFYLFAFFVLITALLLTDSRGALFSLFISTIILIFKLKKKLILPIFLIFTLFLILFLIKNPLNIRKIDLRKESIEKRTLLIKAFPEFFFKKPIFGYGRVYTEEWIKTIDKNKYKKESLEILKEMNHFHNSFLQIIFYFGIIGFLILYSIYFYLLKTLYSKKTLLSFLTFTNLLAFLIHGFFEINIFAEEIFLPLFYFIGISLSEDENNSLFRV